MLCNMCKSDKGCHYFSASDFRNLLIFLFEKRFFQKIFSTIYQTDVWN